MTIVTSPETDISEAAQAVAAMDGHDCAYETYITDHRTKSFGGEAILRAGDVARLEALHGEGYCPPTHGTPTGPTREWADWVQSDWS